MPTRCLLLLVLAELNAPFKGGVFVPAPLVFQFWQQDPAAVKGWSASTALRLTLP